MNNRFDKILSNAFRSQMKQELDALPSDDKLREKFPINKEKRNKIKKLIPKERSLFYLYLQRAAAFILVFGIVTFGLMMTNTEIRANIAEMIGNNEQVIHYDISPDDANVNNTVTYDSFMEGIIAKNKDEIDVVLNMLKENEYGCGAVPDDPADVHAEDLVRLYYFEDPHIVNVYNETGTLANNFNDEYNYKYFSEKEETSIEIRKNENEEWDIAIYDMEVKARKDRFPGQPSTFKEMIADMLEKHPSLDPDSVKYIEYSVLSTYILYFTDSGTEYLATYPLDKSEDEPEYGKIFTLSEYIDIVDEYPVFNRTKPIEGYGGIDIGVVKKTTSTPLYVYPIAGFGITVMLTLLYTLVKRKKSIQQSDKRTC